MHYFVHPELFPFLSYPIAKGLNVSAVRIVVRVDIISRAIKCYHRFRFSQFSLLPQVAEIGPFTMQYAWSCVIPATEVKINSLQGVAVVREVFHAVLLQSVQRVRLPVEKSFQLSPLFLST